jgi:DNA polymerase-1
MGEAKEARENFLRSIPALKGLTERARKAARQGYLVGLDGRRLPIKSEHYALSVYLQGFEAVVMKKAYIDWFFKLRKEGVPFKNLAWVHDEFQSEVQGGRELAGYVGETQKRAITDAGVFFKLNVPLEGSAQYGHSWAQCH